MTFTKLNSRLICENLNLKNLFFGIKNYPFIEF